MTVFFHKAMEYVIPVHLCMIPAPERRPFRYGYPIWSVQMSPPLPPGHVSIKWSLAPSCRSILYFQLFLFLSFYRHCVLSAFSRCLTLLLLLV